MRNIVLLQQVYDATRDGLDIITDLVTGIDDAVINNKKAFRLRPDEKTPSAHLYPPGDKMPYWHVKDYGMGEREGFFSPVDLFMWKCNYDQNQFSMALHELAERYGVREQLSASVNKPEMETRAASSEEIGAQPSVTLKEGFDGVDLSCWGDGVKPEHLESYGWKAVCEVRIPKGDKVYVRKPTPAYPIFAEECIYVDEQGQPQVFYKVYEPKNPDKAHRFFIAGRKPQNYIYGLSAVRKMYEENGEQKLDKLLLVSGGSDAIAALVRGYVSVWRDSEVKGLSEAEYNLLKKYCNQLIAIPDIDETGTKVGQRQALTHLDIYTAWFTASDMNGLHDERGRKCKDLRDFCRLNPSKKVFERFISRAISAKFWTGFQNKGGEETFSLSRTSLDYFLELNGFFTLKDETRKEPLYIRISGCVVQRVTAKAIGHFLKMWMQQQGLPRALQDKVLRSRDLPTNTSSTLQERGDLDFSRSTATSQRFYFKDAVVDVTAESITRTPYNMLSGGRYVWEDAIIPHSYRTTGPMFKVEKQDGSYVVKVCEEPPSKFFKFVINASRMHWRKEDEQGLELSEEERSEEHQCLASKLACIGYLLHGYKAESEAWAPICQDSKLAETEDECNGGSGKSVFLKSISQLLRMFYLDANNASIVDNRFIFDGVTEDTDLIVVDECALRLNYDFFFGRITGNFKGEEKGNHPFLIPFLKSPKLAFATNFVLKRHDASIERRIWPQVFSDFYHVKTSKNDYRESRSVYDDLGCDIMSTEYSEQDWQADIDFMLQCLQYYLSLPKGERKIMPPMNRIERREQLVAVGKDFKEWADDYFAEGGGNLDRELKQNEVLGCYNSETTYQLKMGMFTRKLKEYCALAEHIKCLNPAAITGREKDGERWVKRDGERQNQYYYVQSLKGAAEAIKTEPVQQNLPL